MAQNDHVISDQAGATFLPDLNAVIEALVTNNSGPAAPSVTYPNMRWFDTATDDMKQRNAADSAWVLVGRADGSGWTPYRHGVLLGTASIKNTGAAAGQVPTNDQAFIDVSSAATTPIGAASSENVRVTGTTTITAFDSVAAGLRRRVRFAATLTLTHNATSLILPGEADIPTAANDTAEFISLGAGNWLCLWYKASDGTPVAGGGLPPADFVSAEQAVVFDTTLTVPHGLAASPTLVEVSLVCKTANLGYAPGDQVVGVGGSGSDTGATVYRNDTNVKLIQGVAIQLHDQATKNYATITTGSWRWVIRAWL